MTHLKITQINDSGVVELVRLEESVVELNKMQGVSGSLGSQDLHSEREEKNLKDHLNDGGVGAIVMQHDDRMKRAAWSHNDDV